jgi:hypothetical protein
MLYRLPAVVQQQSPGLLHQYLATQFFYAPRTRNQATPPVKRAINPGLEALARDPAGLQYPVRKSEQLPLAIGPIRQGST